MNKGFIALASGAFALGFAEFIMMGILPDVAHGLDVSVPFAGNFISAYAIGVCIGSLILVFGRKVPPKHMLLFLICLIVGANALCALSPNADVLIAGRVLAGMPHGAYFGMTTIAAKDLARSGRSAQAVAGMVAAQTIANMIGVPFGSWLAQTFSWRAAFGFISIWAVMSLVLTIVLVPKINPIKDDGLLGQFAFLRHPGPWMILAAVLLGNTGLFCW